jgi:hypothetical protein
MKLGKRVGVPGLNFGIGGMGPGHADNRYDHKGIKHLGRRAFEHGRSHFITFLLLGLLGDA